MPAKWFPPPQVVGRITPLEQSATHGIAPNLQFDPTRATAVGDLRSEAKGTGARDNKDKLPAELLPYTAVAKLLPFGMPGRIDSVRDALFALGDFQAGNDDSLREILKAVAVAANVTLEELIAIAANVFRYGMTKYKAWNWAKGMPYTVAMACIYRHLMGDPDTGKKGMWDDPEGLDEESGLMHAGHVACNVLMLSQWLLTYREGDDRSEHLRRPPF